MPYQTTIDQDGARVFTRYFGDLTASELYSSLEERFEDIEVLKKFRVLIADYFDVKSFSTENADVRRFAEVYMNASALNPNVVMVAIMPTDQQFGLGRMWEAYANDMPWRFRIVRSMDEAREWLRKEKVSENYIK